MLYELEFLLIILQNVKLIFLDSFKLTIIKVLLT